MPLHAMPSPAWRSALCMLAGALAAPFLSASPALLVSLCAVLSLILLLLLRPRGPGALRTLLAMLLCFLAGAARYLLDSAPAPPPAPAPDGQTTIVGVIGEEPVRRGSRLQLLLDAAAAGDTVLIPWHTAVRVTLPPPRGESGLPCLSCGMTVAVRGTLAPPPAERNPGEFNPRRYDEANGITHTLTVPAWNALRVLSTTGGSPLMRDVVIPARRAIRSLIDRSVGGEEGELLKGLLIGERGGLSPETKEAFVNAGVAHVLAVSGSNVAVVAAIFLLLLQVLRVPRTPGVCCVAGAALFYMLLTGGQPPVVRATIMALALSGARLLGRRINALNSLGAALIAMLAVDARQVLDVGFQLSFASVAALLTLYPRLSAPLARIPRRTRGTRAALALLKVCAVSLAATLGTFPLAAISFGRVSIIGILVNVAVVPATELSVMLGAAAIAGSLLHPLCAAAYGALNRVLLHWTLVLTRLAGFAPVAYIDTARFSAAAALAYLLVLAVLFRLPVRLAPRLVIAGLLCGLCLLAMPGRDGEERMQGRLRLTILDVGQGDAVVAELPDGTTIMVDAGPRTPAMDAGERTVVPFLKRRGIESVDLLIVSHMHADHAGGVPSLLTGLNVKRVLTLSPSAFRAGLGPLLAADRVTVCDSASPGANLLRLACARLYLLFPAPGPRGTDDPAGNASMVVKLQYGGVSFLLTGDAGGAEEQQLVQRYGPFLRSTVLKVAHHGSGASSGSPFLGSVRPLHAVVSVGKYNAFRHPSARTLARLRACGASVSRTDQEGAVIFETDGSSIHKLEWR